MSFVSLLPGAISEILASIARYHCITKADRFGLMAAVLDESLPEEERKAVNRILRSLVKGRIQVVDELSVIT
ncbi:MAG: hypothetical protein F6K35_32745 [Okeania sp. SIO2H7]|nr:hypothetical protein [Okeania sp. SIO2H7]